MRFAVIATGQSLSGGQIDQVQHLPCIAVSNAYERVPNAVALVSADKRWWLHYQPVFEGRKFSLAKVHEDIEVVPIAMGSNSGLLGMEVAVMLGATSIILLGFDMHGTHYFGSHAAPLRNTQPSRFQAFKQQFAAFNKVPVFNCTPGSELTCFPMMSIQCALSLP